MAKKSTKKSTVKKTIRKAPTKRVAVRKSTPKKTASKKTASKKSVPKKSAPKKSVSKRVTAKPAARAVAKPSSPKKKCSKALPIIGLIINILIAPGLGTLIGDGKKRLRNGLIQLILSIVAWALILTMVGAIIGAPLLFAMWIWSIVDMAKAIGER